MGGSPTKGDEKWDLAGSCTTWLQPCFWGIPPLSKRQGWSHVVHGVFESVLWVSVLAAQDHVGKPVPEYVTGDECLFCHRVQVADTWQENPHARTVRPISVDSDTHGFPSDTTDVLGARAHFRGLKQTGYGKFALLSIDAKSWDNDKFANRCAGCHTTAVDPKTRAFSSIALDCYACHGAVDLKHTGDKALVWLSSKHSKDPVLITSICGQCHLRGGQSRSSGLPYPNNFVAGDSLFLDFQVDWRLADDPKLNAGDRHIYENARDVVQKGGTTTCLNCHQVHGDTSAKHRRVLTGPICLECHNAEGPKKDVKQYAVHSLLCEY